MQDVFRGTAQLPPENPKAALEEYIQPETLAAKALFTLGLLVLKIKKYVPTGLLFAFYYFLINPIVRILVLLWKTLFGSPRNLLFRDSMLLRFLLGEFVPSQGFSKAKTKSLLVKCLKPASFWGLFFLMTGRFSFAFTIFHVRNKNVEPSAQQLYSEALCGFLAKDYVQAFNAAERALVREPEHHCAAAILARCAQETDREYDAIDILCTRASSSFTVALAIIVMVALQKFDAAVSTLMGHIAKSPEDAEAAGDYLLLMLNRRKECLEAYDIAFKHSANRALLFKQALALPLHMNSVEDIRHVREETIKRLDDLKLHPSSQDLSVYYNTYPRISILGVNLDPLYPIIYHFDNDIEITKARAECFLANFPQLHYKAAHTTNTVFRKDTKIRLGLFTESMYPQLDPFWGPLLERLPKDCFHVTLFMPEALSSHYIPRLKNIADAIVAYPYPRPTYHAPVSKSYASEALAKTQALIASCGLDILYTLFIGQDFMAQSLAYSRLAPVQIIDGTRMTTTGMPEVDYYMLHRGDFWGEPEETFTEKLAIFGGCPQVLLDLIKTPPEVADCKRSFFALPDRAVIYLCIQDLTRRHPDMDRILARLLLRDPEGMVVVSDFGTPGIFYDFLRNLQKNGLENPDARVSKAPVFLGVYPKSYYYAFLTLADANLAYRGMCGGTPFYDHLALCIPQIVWPFDYVSNTCAGIYRRMGLEGLLAGSEDEYVEKAYRLAHDRKWKMEMTRLLAEKTRQYANVARQENGIADMRQFFQDAVGRARAGLPPAHWHDGKFYDHLTQKDLKAFISDNNIVS